MATYGFPVIKINFFGWVHAYIHDNTTYDYTPLQVAVKNYSNWIKETHINHMYINKES